ncbi:transglutaminaseTgpA domain-containing protein [Myceligenerans crystallogenes]|uniref:DUF3488 and transglutaminase-like domain-containing protein n=1 Tax=Myceligenerans crystallogenes TaxID=316335 RepID=A0ABP4ZUV9_9MICO
MIPAQHGALTRTVASTALVAVATLASMFALTEVVEAGAWTRAGFVGVLFVALVTGLVRYLLLARAMNRGGGDGATAGRNRDQAADRAAGTVSFLATLAGLAVATWYVLARYGGPDGGGPVFFTGPDEWRAVVARFSEATEIMVTERAPVADSLPMGLVAVSGTLLMFLVADSLAGARMPALAGLPLLVLWTPALSIMGRVPAGTFVVAVTAALLLLTLDQSGAVFARNGGEGPAIARARRSRAWITAVSSVAVAALALGTGIGIAAVPGVSGNFSQLLRTQGQSLELSDEFDMRAGLGRRSTAEVLRYEISGEEQRGPLRERTFTAWDGRRVSWDPGDGPLVEFGPADALMSGPEETAGGSTRLAVTIVSERDGLLPIPVGPRRIGLPEVSRGAWRWDPVLDEVRSDDRLAEGTRYEVEILHRRLTAAALRAAPDRLPANGDHTALVETEHLADTAALAAEITEGAGTRYDQAVALQNWLHHAGGFTYTADTAPARTDDATWDFLTDKQGYCVQFSTAFFVMARSLGIPTRIGVGYLPGNDENDDGVWSVTGEDSHSWPEVWFDGFGWVRFEPTPQVQTGALPDYADIAEQSGGAPSRAPEDPRPTRNPQQEPEQEPTEDAEPTPEPAAGGRGGGARGGPLPWWVWAGTIVLAAAGAAAWLLLRRKADAVVLDPERAWDRVVALCGARGVGLGPSTTLRRAPEEIAGQVERRSGNRLPDEAADALVTLARAAENERYALDYVSPGPAELEELTDAVAAGLTAALGEPDETPAAQAARIIQSLKR